MRSSEKVILIASLSPYSPIFLNWETAIVSDGDYQPMHVVEDVVWINPQLGDVVVDHRDALVLLVQHRDREQLRLKELWQRCHTVQL